MIEKEKRFLSLTGQAEQVTAEEFLKRNTINYGRTDPRGLTIKTVQFVDALEAIRLKEKQVFDSLHKVNPSETLEWHFGDYKFFRKEYVEQEIKQALAEQMKEIFEELEKSMIVIGMDVSIDSGLPLNMWGLNEVGIKKIKSKFVRAVRDKK